MSRRILNRALAGDTKLLLLLHNRVGCRILDALMIAVTYIGGATFCTGLVAALVLFGDQPVRRLGWEMCFTLAISHLLVHLLKKKVGRPRPHTVMHLKQPMEVAICAYSFPSGHTAAAFAMALPLAARVPSLAPLALVLAMAVGLSRMYLGIHYPSDVLVGLGIAMVTSEFVRLALPGLLV